MVVTPVVPTTVAQFGAYEEEAIVSLILDLPEFVQTIIQFIEPDLFTRIETRYIVAWILKIYQEHEVIPTRELLKDQILRDLTADDQYEEVIRILDRKSSPREVPLVRSKLKEWARKKAFGLLYADETVTAFEKGDIATVEAIFKRASHINDTAIRGFWLFDQFEELLVEDAVKRYPTGYKRLDTAFGGGLACGETLIYLAATNVGKSIQLCNNSVNYVNSGLDVLHITCEMLAKKVARRMLGALTDVRMVDFPHHSDHIRRVCSATRANSKAQLAIYEFNPDEISVDNISSLMTMLKRTRGFSPKVVVIDYLELMISRNEYYNRDEYLRQKHVATEFCGLAKSEMVIGLSATQTNRQGSGATDPNKPVDLNKMAESYGKAMPPDFVVSLNQSDEEYHSDPPQIRYFIAKNREGEKLITITCTVDYDRMKIREAAI